MACRCENAGYWGEDSGMLKEGDAVLRFLEFRLNDYCSPLYGYLF